MCFDHVQIVFFLVQSIKLGPVQVQVFIQFQMFIPQQGKRGPGPTRVIVFCVDKIHQKYQTVYHVLCRLSPSSEGGEADFCV